MQNPYLWVKAFHIISLICWMAGMLYLPRLFVYHVTATKGSEASEMLKVMERRLLRFIMNPALILTVIFGLWLVHIDGMEYLQKAGWFHVKVFLVLGMIILHGLFARWRKDFLFDRNIHSARFYRIMNEVPSLIMIIIVILAVVKPF